MRRARLLSVLLAPLFAGCQALGPIAYYLSPPHIQKAEFKIPPESKVAVLFDAARPEYQVPVFNTALFEKLQFYFRKYNSTAHLIPLVHVYQLKRKDPTAFAKSSVQHIGRQLDADYVLYLRIESLETRPSPDYPLITPHVVLRSKLIATQHPASDARVWPENREGLKIECKRQASEYAGPERADAEIAKLGRDTAYFVMMPFFDVDMESPTPVER